MPAGGVRKDILAHFHDHILAGHLAIDRTRTAIRQLREAESGLTSKPLPTDVSSTPKTRRPGTKVASSYSH